MNKIKICLAASAGGHLTELMQLSGFYEKHEHFFISDKRTNAIELRKKKNKVYFVKVPRRNPINLIINFIQSLKIFLNEKPDVILSTGADVAIPILLIGKIFEKKIIFIESVARINEPSLSGKIIYPFSDLFFIQWKKNKKFFPKGIFAGSVFD